MKKWCVMFLFSLINLIGFGQLIIDHNSTNINALTESDINLAKTNLHIVYGHTSHGSQLTTGMEGLVSFANNGGKGLSLATDIFAWNNGGSGGALDLHDYGMGGDVGYYPAWYNNTVTYLDDQNNSDVNVVMWSWCGQVDDKYAAGTLYSDYLEPMALLETSYPDVKFVYMTGHLDHWDDEDNKAANDSIRRHCLREDKILYDFADIESYNPDGTFFEFAHDNCDYYTNSGTLIGNWASDWRASHTENVDWYSCSSAHSDALNANQKAYAAWQMFVSIAKMGVVTATPETGIGTEVLVYPNPFTDNLTIKTQKNGCLEIFDMQGRLILNMEINAPGINISLANLSAGLYAIIIKSDDTSIIRKIMKK